MKLKLSKSEREEAKSWRVEKCGSEKKQQLKMEFGWRLENNIPMELNYKESRRYKKEKEGKDEKERS